MLAQLMIALSVPPLLLVGWAAVQRAWRREFESDPDCDVLAARRGCGSCGCTTPCAKAAGDQPTTEET